MERDEKMKFNELKIDKRILSALELMKFDEMMPIQEQTIPKILDRKNIIGEAHTGTGKTAAFGIPLFEIIDENKNEIQSLIMAPTRELAMQTVSELKKIGKNYKYDIVSLVGGMSISDQAKDLKKKPKIIVATPGRIIDHLERKRLNLNSIKVFILDEVDEMLKVGFKDGIDKIISLLPEDKQTLLFSATISPSVQTIAKKIDNTFELISVTEGSQSTDSITQYYVVTKESNKFNTLTRLLDIDNPKLAIVFGRTKRRADELNEALLKCGYKVSALHGDLSQGQRNTVLRKFKNNEIDILTATDVAARGLDVTGVTHVYNFDLPQEVEYYIHRIGRTGRANDKGISYTFVRESEIPHLEKIKKQTNSIIKIINSPSIIDCKNSNRNRLIKKVDDLINETNKEEHQETIKLLTETYNTEDLALIISEIFSIKNNNKDISLTGEPPVKIKYQRNTNSKYNNFKSNKKRNSNDKRDSYTKSKSTFRSKRNNYSTKKRPI